MSKNLPTKNISTLPASTQYNPEEVELIKNTVAKDATDLELKLFLSYCQRTGLDPLTRQIYFSKGKPDKNGKQKVSMLTSIDGFRLVADRSEQYQGQTPAQWCGADGKWTDIWLQSTPPKAAKVGVWKAGFKEPLYAVAVFDEYAQRYNDGNLQHMWKKMPALMISKVAESLALRKAFPNDLSGLYTQEEMAQADNPELTNTSPTAAKKDEPIVAKAVEIFDAKVVSNGGGGGTGESQEHLEHRETLKKLNTLLSVNGMGALKDDARAKRRTLLESIFGVWKGEELAKLPTDQILKGIETIQQAVDPHNQNTPFPREPGSEG